jgi:cobalt-zinc-cadmium efflux system outer membrane protein
VREFARASLARELASTCGQDDPHWFGAGLCHRPNDRRSIGMGNRKAVMRAGAAAQSIAAATLLGLLASTACAQGPQFDTGSAPGAAGGASTVGQPIGAANFPDITAVSSAPFSGKAGVGGSHVPISFLLSPSAPKFRTTGAQQAIQSLQPLQTTQYGELELPADFEVYGPKDGMVLDAAIERIVKQNLDVIAARMEIPMADADILTANLRTNPIFYADTQLVPYGHFSFLRPGGPPQSDININYPLDISFKRLARTRSFREARNVTEAQLQDFIRTTIDNLYTVYEDDVSAGLNLQFNEIYLRGINRLYTLTDDLLKAGQVKPADLQAVKANLEKSKLGVKEAQQAKIKANRALAVILNLPLHEIERIEKLDVQDPVAKIQALPTSTDELVKKALQVRPDLLSQRYGLRRANADVQVARADAYQDVFLLWQPYTFQNNTYLGVQSAYSWTLGVTAVIPLYNRNQGNITRAKINVTQTEVQLASVERGVIRDVLDAAQELEQSRVAVLQFRNEIDPAAKIVRNTAFNRWRGGEIPMQDYLDAQQDYNDIVRQYRDAIVRHRRAILDLNTAVGERVLP